MAGRNDEAVKVLTSKSSSTTSPVRGIQTDEGNAMLVNDVGRRTFAAKSHPALSVSTTSRNLLVLIKSAIAAIDTAAARADWGMTSNSDLPDDVEAKRGFLFKSASTNTGIIYVGTDNVVTGGTYGMPLAAGESMFVEITQSSSFNLVASAGTQTIHFLAI